jgi:hypothetical protein
VRTLDRAFQGRYRVKNEGMTTSMVEDETKKIPSITFLALALGAMAVSAGLMFGGKKTWANFIGQWVPSILILGTYNKIAKTFSAPFSEEQRIEHGGNRSPVKERGEATGLPPLASH